VKSIAPLQNPSGYCYRISRNRRSDRNRCSSRANGYWRDAEPCGAAPRRMRQMRRLVTRLCRAGAGAWRVLAGVRRVACRPSPPRRGACEAGAPRGIFRQRPPRLCGGTRSRAGAGGKRGWLVKKEQLGVGTAPDDPPAAPEVEHAADPLPRCPAAPRQRLCVCMKTSAAVAHEQPTGTESA
jgi:hypothetical protein